MQGVLNSNITQVLNEWEKGFASLFSGNENVANFQDNFTAHLPWPTQTKTLKNIGYATYSKLYQTCICPVVDNSGGVWGSGYSVN